MLPIGDDNSDRTLTPVVNYLLILVNVLVFVLFQGLGSNERFTYAFSTVPKEIVTGHDVAEPVTIKDPVSGEVAGTVQLEPTPIPVYLTLITSMFMHGGIAHIFGNMLYLWIFGDNVEDRFGHGTFFVFYLLCGLAATFAQLLFSAGSNVPNLGASGAIAGVLGSYLLLFPNSRVRVLQGQQVVQMPAVAVLGFWIVLQLFSGIGSIANTAESGGVAYPRAHEVGTQQWPLWQGTPPERYLRRSHPVGRPI